MLKSLSCNTNFTLSTLYAYYINTADYYKNIRYFYPEYNETHTPTLLYFNADWHS